MSTKRRYSLLSAQDGHSDVRQEAHSLQTEDAISSCIIDGRNDEYALIAGVLDCKGLVRVAAANKVLFKSRVALRIEPCDPAKVDIGLSRDETRVVFKVPRLRVTTSPIGVLHKERVFE